MHDSWTSFLIPPAGTCPPGFWYNVITELCDPCTHGTFKDSSGLQECIQCREGLHTRVRGSTKCEGRMCTWLL